jgi:BON domain
MANPLSQAVGITLAPARLAGRIALGIARQVTGGGQEPPPPPAPAPPRRPRPKDLDDVAIARKVESIIFRDRKVAKGKVNVNVADGVVWLRGEVKTPDLVKQLEAKARAVPEVTAVENLLHLPKTPAPTRTDTPASQRKTRRTRKPPASRRVTPRKVSEEAPAPVGAEPSPRAASAAGEGRRPAPLGGDTENGPEREANGPDTARLDEDPAYNPKDPGLRDLKGG